MAILTSNKIDFKLKMVTGDNEGHYVMTKESIQQEAATIVNIYVHNIGAAKCLKPILTELK